MNPWIFRPADIFSLAHGLGSTHAAAESWSGTDMWLFITPRPEDYLW